MSESGNESGNAAVVARFLEEVINQGRLEQADELVAVDFVSLILFRSAARARGFERGDRNAACGVSGYSLGCGRDGGLWG